MLTPPSPGQHEVLADEAQAELSAASKKTKKQRHRANKQQQQQQHCQLSQQHQVPEHQPLPSSQLSVATACLLQGEKCQRVGESENSQGLCEALQAAHKCKDYLQQGLFAEAVVALVSGCAKSTFCLALLQDTTQLWPAVMAKARFATHKEHGRAKGLPHVLKAAEMVLLGFQLLPEPHGHEFRPLFEEPVFLDPKWSNLCRAQCLSVTDTEWVQALGSYKTAYIWVMTTQEDHDRLSMLELSDGFNAHLAAVLSRCMDVLCYPVHQMRALRCDHPSTFAAICQVRMMQDQLDPKNKDPMSMKQGVGSAFGRFHDPACAMSHVLAGSYMILQLCGGKPDEEMAAKLRWAADQIMLMYNVMKLQSGLWECVETLLLPSMFTLAHVFPLASILGEQHNLLLFINRHHKIQRDQLLRQEEEEQAETNAEADRNRRAASTAARRAS